MFKCKDCGREFYDFSTYQETHGLDSGPYEDVAVCPECSSDDFTEWEPDIEKIEVASALVDVIVTLNHLHSELSDLFGKNFENEDLENARSISIEIIEEMYGDFISSATSKLLQNGTTDNDAEKILLKLEG